MTCFLSLGLATSVCADVQLSTMNFNYDIFTVAGSNIDKPLEIFSTKGQTYIKFSSGVNYKNVPALYIAKDGYGNTPKYHWKKPYIIIDGVVNYMKLVNSSNGKTLFNVKRVKQAYVSVTDSPYVTNQTMDGFLMNLGIGVSKVGSASFGSFSINGAVGWDWAFPESSSRHWLMGFEFGGAYGGSSSSTGISPNTAIPVGSNKYDPNVTSYDIDLLFRTSYVFFSGLYLTGKFGGAYLVDKVDSTTTPVQNSFTKEAFVPEIAGEIGYLTASGYNIGLKANYLFGLSDTVDNAVISANIGVHF